MWLTDSQKVGVAMTAFGAGFFFLGIMMFFDGGLLAIGNLLFLAGITLVIGWQKTIAFFARKEKVRGTACFLGGIFMVLIKWPITGVAVELFGFLNLFGSFFPVILSFLRSLPVIGPVVRHPAIAPTLNWVVGATSALPV
ncbi:Got1-domain-containing protein [Saitoella complicata NRRL Y-17804]|uniref:Got1-domain-containing protein n=1 Tax=Saitoella complicata (strain BCRC 22490 / CBS 7301 / JCM 7358 / NBRC 10748 / NRRL Y-17804) TaxID=698492 RepID=UPI0008670720|nr:Got1-domain-containing protein [Saitoella complicata NRRL Y-17804]ODQ52509.1 Got1-domain-containing protein [Saitoella complicata NRRL Y-17804]